MREKITAMRGSWYNIQNIIYGDCRQILKTYQDNAFDIVLTSPPFKDEDVPGDYWAFYDSFFTEACRVAGKVLIIIHSATKMNEIITRYPPKRTMIWGKGIVAVAWRYNPIFLYQMSEDYKINSYIWSDAFGIAPIKGKHKVHKYQDPDLLYKTILGMFKGCTSVCDPFAGSGTTLKACRDLGLSCVGIELEKDYSVIIEKTLQPEITLLNF